LPNASSSLCRGVHAVCLICGSLTPGRNAVGLMRLVGQQLATMHAADVIHGDLTTSNMMYRCSDGFDEVVSPHVSDL